MRHRPADRTFAAPILNAPALSAFTLTMILLAAGCTGSSSKSDDVATASVPSTGSGSTAGTGSTGGTGSGSGTGTGSGSTPPAAGEPTVTLSASDLQISEGDSVNLSWTTTDADSCTASGGWSGALPANGARNVGPLNAGTTFSLSCTGAGGSALEMLSVSVIGPVQLSWVAPEENVDGSSLTDLAGYRIYYGTSSRSYSDMVDLANPAATAHTLTLASGDYYVAMTALDGEGNESAYSNEVIKTRL